MTIPALAASGGVAALAIGAGLRLYRRLSGRSYLLDGWDRMALSRHDLAGWMRLAEGRPRADVTVCLTTTASRIAYAEGTIASLFRQSTPPRRVHVHVPHVSRREGRAPVVPPWLSEATRAPGTGTDVVLVRCEDEGPATKLLAALPTHAPDDRLLVVDDDVLFPPDFVEAMVRASEAMPDAAVCASGWVVPDDLVDRPTTLVTNLLRKPPVPVRGTVIAEPVRVDVFQGTNGFVVRPRFFDGRVHGLGSAPEPVRWVDDVWLSAHCGAERWVVPLRRLPFAPHHGRGTHDATALGRKNRGTSPETRANTVALRHLQDRWRVAAKTDVSG
ncbi:MAG: hypothetical protein U0169_24770 [Polyangiaceae bacterium]